MLVTGYAILDGFDLGVGILHPLIKGDRERPIVLNGIGPLWDGNKVWLVTFGGTLFAAFPKAYATLFSAFYLPFMFLLFALIGRAVSIEFRSKVKSSRTPRSSTGCSEGRPEARTENRVTYPTPLSFLFQRSAISHAYRSLQTG